jgi:hypothetical protein
MKKYIVGITSITLGGIVLMGIFSPSEQTSEDWQPPTHEELMRYTETTACTDIDGKHEPNHIAH